MIIIKKGFNNSTGWNLGTKGKSSHLVDPFTSTPMNGTKIKKIKETIKNKYDNLKSFFSLKKENPINKKTPKTINIKCLLKKR